MRRRAFIQKAGAAALLLALRLPGSSVHAAGAPGTPVPRFGKRPEIEGRAFADHLVGEDLSIDITILWFIKAATGRLYLKNTAETGVYQAVAEAATTDLVALLTGYRRIGFHAVLQTVFDGGKPRLVTTGLERVSIKTDSEYKSVHHFDYTRRRWTYKVYKNGEQTKRRRKKIAEGVYYDEFISALYNFRLGVYGPVEKGRDYKVTTVPHKEVRYYEAHVCTDEEVAKEEALFVKNFPDAKYVVRFSIDQKIFGAVPGVARFAARDDLLPLGGAIDDVMFLGSVRARCTNPPPRKPGGKTDSAESGG